MSELMGLSCSLAEATWAILRRHFLHGWEVHHGLWSQGPTGILQSRAWCGHDAPRRDLGTREAVCTQSFPPVQRWPCSGTIPRAHEV